MGSWNARPLPRGRNVVVCALSALLLVGCSSDNMTSPLPHLPDLAQENSGRRAAEQALTDEKARLTAERAALEREQARFFAQKAEAEAAGHAKQRETDVLTAALHQEAVLATARVKALRHALDEWDDEVVPLLEKDKGRVLASDERYVRLFFQFYNQPRPGRAELRAVQAHLKAILANPAPSSAALYELQKDRQWAEAAVTQVTNPHAFIYGLLTEATHANLPPARDTLVQAWNAANARDSLRAVDEQRARDAQARADAALAAASALELRMRAEEEARNRKATAEASAADLAYQQRAAQWGSRRNVTAPMPRIFASASGQTVLSTAP